MHRKQFLIFGTLIAITLIGLIVPFIFWNRENDDLAFDPNRPTVDPGRMVLPVRETSFPEVVQVPLNNCTYPREFWIERPLAWPEQVNIGEVRYTREEMRVLFAVQEPDIPSRLLQSLYITFLNILHGADMTVIETSILDANNWLKMNPPTSSLSELNRRIGIDFAATLDGYNQGDYGPGLCPDLPPARDQTRVLPDTAATQVGNLSLPSSTPVVNQNPGQARVTQSPELPLENTSTIVSAPVHTSTPALTIPRLPSSTSLPTHVFTSTPPPTPAATFTSIPTSIPLATSTIAPTPIPAPSQTFTPPAPVVPTSTPTPHIIIEPTITSIPTESYTPSPIPTLTHPPATPTASSSSDPCSGGGGSVDQLRVTSGSSCNLNGTRVRGNIIVEQNAVLVAQSIQVDGNIQATNAGRVEISGSSIGGNIQIKQSGAAAIVSTRVSGDLQFESNFNHLEASYNQVGGNLQAFKNNGGLSISGNTISGNLQCKENNPAPTGGGNNVNGNVEDQCADL
jgi:hypothetical protein